MYDRQKLLNFERSNMMSNADAVECLLDFSKGSDAPFVKNVSNQQSNYTVIEEKFIAKINDKISSYEPYPTNKRIETSTVIKRNPNNRTDNSNKTRAICSFCGKSFAHLGDHNKHRRRHTGERPYACELCPRKFAHASNLARHKRLHSGEKPFECKNCGKRFGRKDKLSLHVTRRRCAKTTKSVLRMDDSVETTREMFS